MHAYTRDTEHDREHATIPTVNKAVRCFPLPLLLVVALILYGSLYPFRFSFPQKALFMWSTPRSLGGVRDIVINLAMYFPLGFLLYGAVRNMTGGVAWAIAGGFLLSTGIEFAQSFDFTRYSSSVDVLMNTLGTCMGVAAASFFNLRIPATLPIRGNPAAVSLLLCMVFSCLFPLFPQTHLAQLRSSVVDFTAPSFDPVQIAFSFLEWTAVRVLLTELLRREAVTGEFLSMGMVIPAGIVITGQSPTWLTLAGFAIAVGVGHRWHPTPRQVAPWIWLDIAGRELMPFHLTLQAQPFRWMPFAGVIEAGPIVVSTLLRKSFLYGTAIWFSRPWILPAATALAILLFFLEQEQRFLPGRTPEITDSAMAVLLGLALWWLWRRFCVTHNDVLDKVHV